MRWRRRLGLRGLFLGTVKRVPALLCLLVEAGADAINRVPALLVRVAIMLSNYSPTVATPLVGVPSWYPTIYMYRNAAVSPVILSAAKNLRDLARDSSLRSE